jgi:ABC-type phosphate/phosphonate transport system substrate-binding protein
MGQQQRANSGERRRKGGPLNALTFLAPGIPLEFFEIVTGCIAEALSCEIQLSAEDRISGPMHAAADPFDEGRADLGFLCSPSYLYLRAQARPSVELVPAGFVFRDRRAAGRPVYFSEVVVRSDHSAREFADLAGSVWGYNDECSLSGYFSALQKLSELGCDGSFFGRRVRTGSHLESVEAVLSGAIDGAAID